MIKLNEYESQILLFAKGHYDEELRKIPIPEDRWGFHVIGFFIKALHHKHYSLTIGEDARLFTFFRENLIDLIERIYSNDDNVDKSHLMKAIHNSCFVSRDDLVGFELLNMNDIIARTINADKINNLICIKSIRTVLSALKTVQVQDYTNSDIIKYEDKDENLISNYIAHISQENEELKNG